MTFLVVALAVAVLALSLLWSRARATLRDLRAREAAREATLQQLQREVARLAAALGGAGDGLIVLDEADRVVATNPAAQELAALPSHDPRGRRIADLVPWPALHRAIAASGDGGQAQAFELDEAAGYGRALAVRVRALQGLGNVIGIDDQSRLKRLESLRRDFVANVSHELKTPLAAIQGFVETLLDDPAMPLPTRQRFLERIVRQAHRLTTLVADLLTLSRLDDDAGMQREVEPCDFAAVLRETVRDLLPLAEKRGVALAAAVPAAAFWVRADREALRQVAGNLIDNAIKYTPAAGRVTVQLTAREQRLLLEVIDTGIGLSPADCERVFERFYRVDRARSRELGGTGLGLSIVKNTVRNLGGDVGVSSELGKGSTFWVALPHEVVCDADGAGRVIG